MAYNNRNLLTKIIEIQDIVIREQKKGVNQRFIYHQYIKEVYFISESTFNNYLARNARKELAILNRQLEEQKAQMLLDFD